ncbi:MAG: inositol monophosphatase family protein [Pseudomonadota bacterium]|nr:inositol monophosphatase family protein [Pseudomonadota bacterium]
MSLSRDDLLKVSLEILHAAKEPALRYFRTALQVSDKEDESPVTVGDRETEKALRAEIKRRFPDHGVIGEEFGSDNPEAEYVWIVDPIDGTKSFISGMPLFGTLLGLLHQGRPIVGTIGMPALGEDFAGAVNGHSVMNGAVISCRETKNLHAAFVCCNELPSLFTTHPQLVSELTSRPRYLRPSNDCYPYAQLAAGWVDAVVDCNLQPYDYLPLVGVIEGAGGVITDWSGAPLTLHSDGRVIAAATAELHAEMVALFERVT